MNTEHASTSEALEEISAILDNSPGCVVQRRAPSTNYSTYRVGGALSLLVEVESAEGLQALLEVPGLGSVPLLTVGRGSNLLVSDAGFEGLAVRLGEGFSSIDVGEPNEFGEVVVTAGASASLPVVARATVASGLTGFEWAVGVPGSIGGAVRMNAGGHGSDMAASLMSVQVADLALGGFVQRSVESLGLGYRHSSIQPWEVVVGASLRLTQSATHDGAETLSEIVRWRREHQPGGANAGSVFTNPDGDSAGRLIDCSGLKGFRYGTAEVSPKHANFIQADPDGAAADVVAVMVRIIDVVESLHGVRLVPETCLVGFDTETMDQLSRQSKQPGALDG